MPATPPLFLLDELPPDPALVGDTMLGADTILGGEEGRHAGQVLRMRAGEALWLSDGRGALLECTVTAVLAAGVALRVEQRRAVPAPRPRLSVVQALPKGDRGELAVELMTELGVDAIVPWAAARSVAQWAGARGERSRDKWRRTAREAAKQSRRAWVPDILPLASTRAVAELIGGRAAFVLHESASAPLADCELPDADELILVVGPEGGVADDELTAFAAAGASAVRLGSPVLRTSTAGAAALAALSVRLGRWR